jgi:hypothetical protein
METPEGWKTISLEELLSKEDIRKVKDLLKKDDMKGLKELLQSREVTLMEKGVLPTYLYYYLQYAKNTLKEVV